MVTLVLGGQAVGSDGYRSEVVAVVLDPAVGTVTHLMVEPEGRLGLARLVSLDLADIDAASGEVRLRCDLGDFQGQEPAEETLTEFVLGYQVPVQPLPPDWRGTGGPVTPGGTIPRTPEEETLDVIPPGEVEERPGGHVHATDGDIGQVRALRIDLASGRVTHFLVREGHLLARKDVAIPFASVAGFDHGIRLGITRQQVRDLPPAETDPSAG